ncbi:hypothetical protein IAT38_005031 [Cryptococcus sp. DSM 104549]
MSGPLGVLPGMTFDPLRNRYFPTPKGPPTTDDSGGSRDGTPDGIGGGRRSRSASASASASGSGSGYNSAAGLEGARRRAGKFRREFDCVGKKRGRENSLGGGGGCEDGGRTEGGGKVRWKGGRGRMGIGLGARGGKGMVVSDEESLIRRLEFEAEHQSCGCHGETITSYRSFGRESYLATTDHGKMVMHGASGHTMVFYICPQTLIGMHCDIARMTMIALSGGPDPHLHMFQRDPEMLDHVFMSHTELNLPSGDLFSTSSFDDTCTIGGTKSLTVIHYASELTSRPRRLESDALALHQVSSDLVYVGQRSGKVALVDLREHGKATNTAASTVKRKAVVGVKRLADGAVPWGLAVSGMSHEMLLFDVRYADKPLQTFKGHVNNFQSNLGMSLSPSNSFLFSAGSDQRIRCWSTLTGDPVLPETDYFEQETDSPLVRKFDDKVSQLAVREDLGIDVVVCGDLLRYGRMV